MQNTTNADCRDIEPKGENADSREVLELTLDELSYIAGGIIRNKLDFVRVS
ncbi:MAG TPA: hypothetical protein VEK74_05350 [Burkholderiaceae bacterium]|nr:hypothetical protein [Burkholderiaceae bacterium]